MNWRVVDGDDLIYSYTLLDGTMPDSGGMPALFTDTVARPGVAGWAGVAARDCATAGCADTLSTKQ